MISEEQGHKITIKIGEALEKLKDELLAEHGLCALDTSSRFDSDWDDAEANLRCAMLNELDTLLT
jgi:hypothetical protein